MKIVTGNIPDALALASAICGLVLLLSACSSTPRPDAELAAANAALRSATNQDATQYAPVAMDRASDKLRRAERAMQQENYNEARRLAEEAQADAELALAINGKIEADTAVRELESNIKILREEIDRGLDQ